MFFPWDEQFNLCENILQTQSGRKVYGKGVMTARSFLSNKSNNSESLW